tara:strand:+ start:1258 stop:1656 length:399 start_codon:yes stop_codon:yes gene_type:complete
LEAIGPSLPLTRDTRSGVFSLITSYDEEIKQNFKNLILTSPGERVMNPDFGVGIRNYLFENRSNAKSAIEQRLRSQVERYMPFISLQDVIFDYSDELGVPLEDRQILSIRIVYSVPDLNLESAININDGTLT